MTHSDAKKQLLFCGLGHILQIGKVLNELLGYKQVAHVGIKREWPELNITFDPAQPIACYPEDSPSFLQEDLYDIIKADDPERFAPGAFS
jgi:hypothetical protein